MRRSEFETRDTDEAHEYLREQYADHLPRLSGDREAFECNATVTGEERFAIEYLKHSMELRTVVEPYPAVMVPHMLSGRMRLADQGSEVRLGPGGLCAVPPDERIAVQWDGVEIGMVRFEVEPLLALAAEHGDGVPRFELSGPVSPERARYWRSVMAHVTRDFIKDPVAMGSPMLRTEVYRLLGAALFTAFPLKCEARSPGIVGHGAVRRAITYIAENAHSDIGTTDIAEAARLSPRALQVAFRRHLGCTPSAYLRQVRMDQVHLGLRAADPTKGDTVAAIARQWGFLHLGHFAAAYRSRYGCSPHETLRG